MAERRLKTAIKLETADAATSQARTPIHIEAGDRAGPHAAQPGADRKPSARTHI